MKDVYHDTVKNALQKADWTITHEQFPLKIGKKRLSIDLGAERLISAERGIKKIVANAIILSATKTHYAKDAENCGGHEALSKHAGTWCNCADCPVVDSGSECCSQSICFGGRST